MIGKIDVRSVTIIGGTGTLGKEVLAQATRKWPQARITILSRDEHKQAALKREFPNARYVIGDVRDINSIKPHVSNRDVVFHVAAMKHVDIIEENPLESIKTNVLGTMNVAQASIDGGARYVVYSSTDKAVDPINAYGYGKALSERMVYQLNRQPSYTRFAVYRWGNVLGSNGSAIPFFINTLANESKVYLTHKDMTRFWIPISEAVKYMTETFPMASMNEAMIPPGLRAAPIVEICDMLADMLGIAHYEQVITGIRSGEKLHEAMHSQHSQEHITSETCKRYKPDELKELLLPFVSKHMHGVTA